MSNTTRVKQIKGDTSGSVLFIGAGGHATEDNANLYWDDSNNRLGIGTTSPTEKLHIDGNARVTGAYYDTTNSPGTVDQILSSTITGTTWIDQSAITADAATLVVIACKNTSGGTITVGTPVYQTGNVGATATIEIAPADALISAGNYPAIGLLKTTLVNNALGFVVISGALTNIITSPIDGDVPTTGDTVYLKSGGGLTLTKPTGEGNAIQNMGLVGKVSAGTAGSITVSSIMRANDVPNLPEGRIWVGDGNTLVSDTVFIDEPNLRLGIGTTLPGAPLHITDGGTEPTWSTQEVAIFQKNSSDSESAKVAIIAGASGNSIIEFGDVETQKAGQIVYDHSTNSMSINVNSGTTAIYAANNGNVGIGGGIDAPFNTTFAGAADGTVGFDAFTIINTNTANITGKFNIIRGNDTYTLPSASSNQGRIIHVATIVSTVKINVVTGDRMNGTLNGNTLLYTSSGAIFAAYNYIGRSGNDPGWVRIG